MTFTVQTKHNVKEVAEKRNRQVEMYGKKLTNNGYYAVDATEELRPVIWKTVFLMVPVGILLYFWYASRGPFAIVNADPWYTLAFMLGMSTVLTVLHEFIHGFTWSLFLDGGLKTIEFGIVVRDLAPYCNSNSPLKLWQYVLGTIMPFIVTGLIPAIIGIAIHDPLLFIVSEGMVFGAGADVLMVLKLLQFWKIRDAAVCLDHPNRLGVVVYIPEECEAPDRFRTRIVEPAAQRQTNAS